MNGANNIVRRFASSYVDKAAENAGTNLWIRSTACMIFVREKPLGDHRRE
jgi:hypothetical protein